jgi:hypothetical protein
MVSGCRVASEIAYKHGYCVFSLIGTRLIHCITQGGSSMPFMGGSVNFAQLITQGVY